MRRREQVQPCRELLATSSLAALIGILGLLVAMSFQGCSTTAPAGATEGVMVYEHSNYQGQIRRLGADERDLDDVVGPCNSGNWDDCISSIRVPVGWQAILYEHPNFDGRSLTVTSDIQNLWTKNVEGWNGCGSNWDDCASSVRISQQ